MKSRISLSLNVLSILIVANLLCCGPAGKYPASQNATHAAAPVQSEPSPEKSITKPPPVACEPPFGEKRKEAGEAGLTKADLTGIWINEKLDRLLTKSRSIIGAIQDQSCRDCGTVGFEFREGNPNPALSLSNHDGPQEKIELKDGELFCYGDYSWDRKAPHGKFVLSSRYGRRCIQYRHIPGVEDYAGLPDGIVFCRPRSPDADDTEKYFRGLLAGRYILEPGGQRVVLYEDGRVEGLNGYEQYDVDNDFTILHEESDSGDLHKKDWTTIGFHWKWQGDRLMIYSVYCNDVQGCDPTEMKTGKILYVLQKTD
jgi:hypothetical protein